jgi:hypothetical protein
VDSVHGRWTTVGMHDPLWTSGGANTSTPGRGGPLTRVGPLASTKRGSSPPGWKRERGARESCLEPHRSSSGGVVVG